MQSSQLLDDIVWVRHKHERAIAYFSEQRVSGADLKLAPRFFRDHESTVIRYLDPYCHHPSPEPFAHSERMLPRPRAAVQTIPARSSGHFWLTPGSGAGGKHERRHAGREK